jgi:hypothetical protein
MLLAFAGHCYGTNAEALAAFQASFPLLGDVNLTTHTSSTISIGGTITYSLLSRAFSANTAAAARTGTIALPTCAAIDAPAFDPVAAAGIFAFFFLGVASTWLLSQNIGLIFTAIKKW